MKFDTTVLTSFYSEKHTRCSLGTLALNHFFYPFMTILGVVKTAFWAPKFTHKAGVGEGNRISVLRVLSGHSRSQGHMVWLPAKGSGFSFPVSSGNCTAVPSRQGLCNQIIVAYSIRILRKFGIRSRGRTAEEIKLHSWELPVHVYKTFALSRELSSQNTRAYQMHVRSEMPLWESQRLSAAWKTNTPSSSTCSGNCEDNFNTKHRHVPTAPTADCYTHFDLNQISLFYRT